MLFDRKRSKRGVKEFKYRIPEEDLPQKKISPRLGMGLLAPFLVVAVFLLVLSQRKVSPPEPKQAPMPTEAAAPLEIANEKVRTPSVPQASHPAITEPVSIRPVNPPDQDLTFFKTLKEGEKTVAPVVTSPKKDVTPTAGVSAGAIKPKITKEAVTPAAGVTTPTQDKGKKGEAPIKPSTLERVAKAISTPVKPSSKTVAPRASGVTTPAGKTKPVQADFAIQVGAFPDKEEAGRLAFRLKEQGYDAYILLAKIPNQGLWHRVRVGHYKERSEAEEAAKKLSEAEQLAFFIVSNQ